MALLVWLNSAWNCWTVSYISLPQQAVCCYVKNTDDQLGNVNDIHKSDCAHCQWFHKSLLTFWNCYLALIIISFLNALFSLFLTGAYHYSHRYQSQCHRRLPNLNVPYFEWHWMSSLDIYMSASNLKPSRFSSSGYPFGLLHLDFNQVLWHEEPVCPVYLLLFQS